MEIATNITNFTPNLVDYFYECFFPLWFFLVNPYREMFPNLKVPRYVDKMLPGFILLSVIENGIRLWQGKAILRINDSIASVSSGIFQECLRLCIRSIEVLCYGAVYEHFRLVTLPWDSLATWLVCFVAVDFGFYWFHRACHEVNFMWAIHQAHHSGEDFTILAALRQAVLQPFVAWFSHIPWAILGVPPQIFLVHLQLSELFMVWIHTEVVPWLGPLEWILNCPSHHRVHHARNRKYIDKNYGGTLIIWDRLFGTYESEDPSEPVVYGLVTSVKSYNPFYLQFHSWFDMIDKIQNAPNWKVKMVIPFMGPSWAPGKPRLGYIDEIPKLNHPFTYWDPPISMLTKCYVIIHFALILLFYHHVNTSSELNHWSQLSIFYAVLTLIFSISTIGFLLEEKSYANQLEILRCLFVIKTPFLETYPLLQWIFIISALFCVIYEFYTFVSKIVKMQQFLD